VVPLEANSYKPCRSLYVPGFFVVMLLLLPFVMVAHLHLHPELLNLLVVMVGSRAHAHLTWLHLRILLLSA